MGLEATSPWSRFWQIPFLVKALFLAFRVTFFLSQGLFSANARVERGLLVSASYNPMDSSPTLMISFSFYSLCKGPCLQIQSHWRLGFQYMNWGGRHNSISPYDKDLLKYQKQYDVWNFFQNIRVLAVSNDSGYELIIVEADGRPVRLRYTVLFSACVR